MIQYIVKNRGHTHWAIGLIYFAFLYAKIICYVRFVWQPDGCTINRAKAKSFPGFVMIDALVNTINELSIELDECTV